MTDYVIHLPIVANGVTIMPERALGIDVSKWQDANSTAQQMDFAKAYAAGARFVFIKTSQALYQDEDILYNWKTARAAGLLRGGYHFLDWATDPVAQARYAWSLVQADPGELPPVCDFESWGIVPANAEDILYAYLVEMERLSGRIPMIYTGAYFWKAQANQEEKWSRFPLWVASYTTQGYMELNVTNMTPWSKWTFWQYTSKGDGLAFGAESLNLDMDYFNGSYADLLAFAGVTPPEPPAPVVDLDAIYGEVNDLRDSVVAASGNLQSELATKQRELADMQVELAELQAAALALQTHTNVETDYILKLIKPEG